MRTSILIRVPFRWTLALVIVLMLAPSKVVFAKEKSINIKSAHTHIKLVLKSPEKIKVVVKSKNVSAKGASTTQAGASASTQVVTNQGPPQTPHLTLAAPIGGWINATQFGLVPDGVTDNYGPITLAIAQATKQKAGVYLPTGSYAYSQAIVLNGVQLIGDGAGTNLIPVNSASGCVVVTGTGASLSKVSISYANPSRVPFYLANIPDPYPASSAVLVNGANGWAISQVTVVNSPNNGIDIINGLSNGSLSSTLQHGNIWRHQWRN